MSENNHSLSPRPATANTVNMTAAIGRTPVQVLSQLVLSVDPGPQSHSAVGRIGQDGAEKILACLRANGFIVCEAHTSADGSHPMTFSRPF